MYKNQDSNNLSKIKIFKRENYFEISNKKLYFMYSLCFSK